jgi:hypothetical protein
LKPILASKTNIDVMIRFLLSQNGYYMVEGIQYSKDNMGSLFDDKISGDRGVPSGVGICCLPDESCTPVTDGAPYDPDALVMEAVGYTVGERTPQDSRNMKVAAVAWCLDKKNFVKMQSGSKFISDRNPGLLTFNVPNFDPWGIGGFYEPNRTDAQYITFERQVRNLLLQWDGSFQRDPNFAYVCWNIIQKQEVNNHARFRADASHSSIVENVQEMGPLLTDLIGKWELNPKAKPSNAAEKNLCGL